MPLTSSRSTPTRRSRRTAFDPDDVDAAIDDSMAAISPAKGRHAHTWSVVARPYAGVPPRGAPDDAGLGGRRPSSGESVRAG